MNLTIESTSSSQSEQMISSFLAEHYSGVIATADMAASPHAAVVYYLPDPDFTISFVTKEETQKYKNIEANRQVAFVIYDETKQTSLQVFGYVQVVNELEKKRETIRNMTNSSLTLSSRLLPPAYKLEAGEYAVLQLVPKVMKMAVYSQSEDKDNIYETLLFGER